MQATDTRFESLRPRLFGLAYRMLSSKAEAEDVVQDAYVRWHQTDQSTVANVEAWLVTAATRLAIDRLRALKTEREAYKGPWLPEPLMSAVPPPDRNAQMESDLSIAFLLLLERLGPEERAAFLLHDVFDSPYEEIAAVLGKSAPACRQMIHRARERIRSDQKRYSVTGAARTRLLQQFTAALATRDEKSLFALFAPDATWTADGGGRTPAAPYPIEGAPRITRLLMGLLSRIYNEASFELTGVNGEAGLAVRLQGVLSGILSIDCDENRIHRVYIVLNPEKIQSSVTT